MANSRDNNRRLGPGNITKANIMRKRKQQARRRRRALFRLLLLSIIFAACAIGIIFVGYKLVNWGSYIYGEYQSMYQGYAERQQERRGVIDPRFDGYTNILVLGLDDGAGSPYEAPQTAEGEAPVFKQADTILVISLDNGNGRVRFINIPRDTWVNFPGGGQGRIADLYPAGKAPLMVRKVNELLGISIHQYVVLDMRTCAHLIDALGGIDIYIETDMDYEDAAAGLKIHLKQGYRHLSGAEALQYLRFRGEDLGDLGRVQRQQKFVKALYSAMLQLDTVPRLPDIADIFQKEVETSAEVFDSAHLANVLRGISGDAPVSLMLPGTPAENDANIWLPDAAAIQARMQELFRPADLENARTGEQQEEE